MASGLFSKSKKQVMDKPETKEYKTFLDLFFPTAEKYSVAVLDDDEYFNTLMTEVLKHYSSNLAVLYQAQIEVHSYLKVDDFFKGINSKDFKGTRKVLFIDYYLNDSQKAIDVLNQLQPDKDRRIVIISETKNFQIAAEAKQLGATQFIRKDQFTHFMCTSLLEEFIREDASS